MNEIQAEDSTLVDAARAGDESAFGTLVERHRRELRVHCYRMLGSFEEAEDMVQETFLRAWRGRAGFEGRSTFRAWLYRIATNACLDFLDRHPRRPLPRQAPVVEGGAVPPPPAPPSGHISWLQPYPDRLLEPAAPSEAEPDAAVVAKETIELAFLAAIQHLPPRQRAVLILRDVVGLPAQETAALLEMSVPAIKSALQRARPALREHLPERRSEWAPSSDPTREERAVLQRYIDAVEQADPAVLAGILRDDAWQSMPPQPMWILGGKAIVEAWRPAMVGPESWGDWRVLPVHANRQPAAAAYLRRAGESVYRPSWLGVLRVEDGLITQITTFGDEVFPAFGLPAEL
ncbi:sigma-70 family RNA polymerase sigma factor [Planobispora takensis]|uniref:RNA polymerase sigma factor n=1 Tax=Planobispora takensis TaxID=1367882 RepID=A0A8J3WVB8_9ACTN|nr:sigma-70 family RNA polymerase sigma factor [Planobispora takensis]GII02890.1 RNA polymerase sigma factor [Planobispora takensis]